MRLETYRRMVYCLFAAAAGSGTIAGCSPAEEYEMRQPIEMGPFTFELQSASASLDVQETQRRRIISVTFHVVENESRPRIDFDDFLNDTDPRERINVKLFVPPHYKLLDSHGHDFIGFVSGAGGRPQAHFHITSVHKLLEWDEERIQRFEEAHLKTRPSDYRLIIENPDRREGQPRAVRIQLR